MTELILVALVVVGLKDGITDIIRPRPGRLLGVVVGLKDGITDIE